MGTCTWVWLSSDGGSWPLGPRVVASPDEPATRKYWPPPWLRVSLVTQGRRIEVRRSNSATYCSRYFAICAMDIALGSYACRGLRGRRSGRPALGRGGEAAPCGAAAARGRAGASLSAGGGGGAGGAGGGPGGGP